MLKGRSMTRKHYPGEMVFNSDNYLGIHAIPVNNPLKDDVPNFLLEWEDADGFIKGLRQAADFIEKHRKTCFFEVHLD